MRDYELFENTENYDSRESPLPKVPEDHEDQKLYSSVKYLDLSDKIRSTEIVPGEKFNLHSRGVTPQLLSIMELMEINVFSVKIFTNKES